MSVNIIARLNSGNEPNTVAVKKENSETVSVSEQFGIISDTSLSLGKGELI